MTIPVLDLTAGVLDIRFQRGSTFDPIFWYLNPDNTPVNLSGYRAKMQAKLSYGATEPLSHWDLTTENGGIAIVTGTAILADGTAVSNAYGVQPNVSATATADGTWQKALYDLDLLTGTTNIPFLSGKLIAELQVTP